MVSLSPTPLLALFALVLVVLNNYVGLDAQVGIIGEQNQEILGLPHDLSDETSHSFNVTTDATSQHRKLFPKLSRFTDPKTTTARIPDPLDIEDDDYPPLEPYSLYNVLLTLPTFKRELFLLYYSPQNDEFHVYINESKDGWVAALENRVYQIIPMLAYALRNHFPDRFDGTSDFIILASSGDEPKLDCKCVDRMTRYEVPMCKNEEFAPILQFGAVFQDESILPSMVTMPVWHHLPCLKQWQQTQTICTLYEKRAMAAGVIGGEEAVDRAIARGGAPATRLERIWDRLIPQIIWRGSDFGFLWCIHPQLRLFDFETDITKRIMLSQCVDSAMGVLRCMSQLWEILTPRWRGVFWSMEADLDVRKSKKEAEAKGESTMLAWLNAKFFIKSYKFGKVVDGELDNYTPFEKYGFSVATDKFMSLSELSHYRYHVDFGGGGGTTFSGTIEKLSMPGVLFHHITSTKDYFHDDLIPWMHYIPIEEGMADLREMYDWAVSNSEQAMRISEAGSEYVRSWARPEVMNEMYNKYFVKALGRVIRAYQSSGEDVAAVLKEKKWTLIAKGSGKDLTFTYTKKAKR